MLQAIVRICPQLQQLMILLFAPGVSNLSGSSVHLLWCDAVVPTFSACKQEEATSQGKFS
jgi:hypothetical protein